MNNDIATITKEYNNLIRGDAYKLTYKQVSDRLQEIRDGKANASHPVIQKLKSIITK